MTIYSLHILLSQFGTILLFHAHSIASWRVYRFLRGHITWSGIPISFRIFHSLLWSTQSKSFDIVNKTEVGVFMKFSCFFYDPLNFGNLLSGFSTFFLNPAQISGSSWSMYLLLKPSLENFEHYVASMWGECDSAVIWTHFGIAFLWDWNKNWPFPVLWPLLSFPLLLSRWVQHFQSIMF